MFECFLNDIWNALPKCCHPLLRNESKFKVKRDVTTFNRCVLKNDVFVQGAIDWVKINHFTWNTRFEKFFSLTGQSKLCDKSSYHLLYRDFMNRRPFSAQNSFTNALKRLFFDLECLPASQFSSSFWSIRNIGSTRRLRFVQRSKMPIYVKLHPCPQLRMTMTNKLFTLKGQSHHHAFILGLIRRFHRLNSLPRHTRQKLKAISKENVKVNPYLSVMTAFFLAALWMMSMRLDLCEL